MAKSAINASGAMLLPSSVQVSESISGSVVPLAMFFVSLSLSWMENLFFLASLYFSFFYSLIVCILKSGRWDGFLCDSFVMDADGERFLLVSPPDYEMKTDFSLICGSDKKG